MNSVTLVSQYNTVKMDREFKQCNTERLKTLCERAGLEVSENRQEMIAMLVENTSKTLAAIGNGESSRNDILVNVAGDTSNTLAAMGNGESSRNDILGNMAGETQGSQQNRTRAELVTHPRDLQGGRSSFTFKDIEESIEHFTGDDQKDIGKWLRDFEEMSELIGWNDLQRLIYARRLMRGTAKLFINSGELVNSWEHFQELLISEFGVKVNSAIVHKQLAKRWKRNNETYQQYVYAMVDIANQAKVEEEAVVMYIIDGIKDIASNKAVLYEANNISTIKERLKTYERMKQRESMFGRNTLSTTRGVAETEATNIFKTTPHNNNREARRRYKCFSCKSDEHEKKNCPKVRCYVCNELGHLSTYCPRKQERPTGNVNIISSNKIMKEVVIAGKQVSAMCDTGSDITCMKLRIYQQLNGAASLENRNRYITGIGNNQINVVGEFRAKIQVDAGSFEENIIVLQNEEMQMDMILGLTLFNQATVTFNTSKGDVSIVKNNFKNPDHEIVNIYEAEDMQELETTNELMKIDISEVKSNIVHESPIAELIKNYRPVKQVDTPIETKIVLTSEAPIYQRPRRMAPKEKSIVNNQVAEWLRDGIIRESSSEFASPVVVVKKKCGKYRVCIDYRRINKHIVRDHYPMPLIEDQIDQLSRARVFSVLDLKNGFFHVPMEKSSIRYTSFVTSEGQYEFLKTPFGLSVSPTSFLRYVHNVFKKLTQEKIIFTYMDDLIVPSIDEKEGITKMRQVLNTAEQAGLVLNWEKCSFLQRKVIFLGYEIAEGKRRPSPTTVEGVAKASEPKSVVEVQRFLGLCGYFRKFVEGFALISKPLTELTKKDAIFHFGEKERSAWEYLKKTLTNEPVLKIYDCELETELHTDASQMGYGAILLQKCMEDGQWHPVYYLSKQTSEAEKKYHSYELEMLAIVYAFQKLRVYLLGKQVTIVTDCAAIKNTMEKADITPRIARWVMQLQEFDYITQHRAGNKMRHVDALSRTVMQIDDRLTNSLRECQNKDEHLKVIMDILKDHPYEEYEMQRGILMKNVNGKNVYVVPKEMQTDIIRKIHDNGHFGTKKMTDVLELDYYIPQLRSKIDTIIRNCIPCILAERKKGKQEGLLRPIPKEDAPLLTYHLDHLGPMHLTSKKYKYLFIIVDAFTKFVWIYPTKTTNTQEVLSCMEKQKRTFGNPRRIITDRGSAFTSTAFEEYCETELIEHIKVTTGVPRGNGQVERINQIIIPILTKLSGDQPDKWYMNVDRVQRCINATYQRSIGRTPFEIMLGVKMRQAEDIKVLGLLEEEMAEAFIDEREQSRIEAKEQIRQRQEEQRQYYNRKCKQARQYNPKELVAIERTQFAPGLKLKGKYIGPYEVIKNMGQDRYEMRKMGKSEGPIITTSAADKMKPWRYHDSSRTKE